MNWFICTCNLRALVGWIWKAKDLQERELLHSNRNSHGGGNSVVIVVVQKRNMKNIRSHCSKAFQREPGMCYQVSLPYEHELGVKRPSSAPKGWYSPLCSAFWAPSWSHPLSHCCLEAVSYFESIFPARKVERRNSFPFQSSKSLSSNISSKFSSSFLKFSLKLDSFLFNTFLSSKTLSYTVKWGIHHFLPFA